MKNKLIQRFTETYDMGGEPQVYFAPGRVNLIGEHIDYNGGHVFPCALTLGTYAVVRKRADKKLRFYSMNFENAGIIEASMEGLKYNLEDGWTNYPKGMISTIMDKGYHMDCGLDIMYYGNIPNGSGLSSSASLEILTGFFLNDLFCLGINNIGLALIGQYSENHYNGVSCGIMDQFAVAMGRKNSAIILNTVNLSYEYAPIHLENEKIVILNTNKKRKLGESKYNERRRECQAAVSDLQKVTDIEYLCDLDEQMFETYKHAIKNPICQKRAKHVVYENQRTLKAVDALKNNDIEAFGKLMIASHESLRSDYDVTGVELDTIVKAALECKDVIGARMTGAGFGGCAVSIVKEYAVTDFIEKTGEYYKNKIGYEAEFYIVEIGDGPRQL